MIELISMESFYACEFYWLEFELFAASSNGKLIYTVLHLQVNEFGFIVRFYSIARLSESWGMLRTTFKKLLSV